MRKFVFKYLIVSFFALLGAMLLWSVIVYFWFQSTVQKSLDPVMEKTKTELAGSVEDNTVSTRDRLKLFFSDLEQSKEIITFSFLSEDKSQNYTEGLRKRDSILWPLYVIYPVTIGNTITGWIKVWPAPELVLQAFFSEKNLLILFGSFVLTILIVFCLTAVYFVVKFLIPLASFRKNIKDIANGNAPDIKMNYKRDEWKEIGIALKKLNSKVLDINGTVSMLFSVSKALTSQVDTNQIYNITMSIIQKKFPDAMCAVILPGEDGSLRVVAKRGYSPQFVKSMKMEDGNPVADTFVTGKMTIVKNMSLMVEKFSKIFTGEQVVTQINIPLMDENHVCLGVLNVSAKSTDIFDTDIADTIATVGKYLSIGLRNARMYDRMQELNRRLETEVNITSNELLQTNARLIRKVRDIKALSDISAFASVKFDLNEIAGFAIQKITELTGFETSAVLVLDRTANEFKLLKGSFGVDYKNISSIRLSSENSDIVKTLEETKLPIVFNDAALVKQRAPKVAEILPVSSALFVPIENNGKLTGIITSVNKLGSEISENDIAIIEHIAVLFSGIIEKVRLYSVLKKKVDNLTFLQRISSAISKTPDLEKTLANIIDVTKDAFKADLCAVLLYDKESQNLITRPGAFFTGGSEKVLLKIHKDDQNSLSARTFREGVPYLSKDATADPSIKSQSAREWGIKSIIVVPLIYDEEVIGVLRVGKHDAGVYTEEDKDLIVMIANQAAILIENAHLYDELSTCKVSQ